MKKSKAIIWGVVLIAAGICWALSSLGLFEINIFFDGWWTMFIIVPCAIALFKSEDKSAPIVGIVIGVILLLCAQDIIKFDMIKNLIIPAIIVFIGVKLIANSIFDKKTEKIKETFNDNAEDLENVFCIFSGQNVNCNGKVFKGAELNAVFGGIEYDLRGALIEQDTMIRASAIFGGIDILVPDNVKVRVKPIGIFGGTSNKARKAEDGDNTVTLYVSSVAIFGGIDIK